MQIKSIPRHWTFEYLIDRTRLFIYEKMHPTLPWINKDAISWLENRNLHLLSMLEFGSGRSTLWFAPRVKKLVSVENDAEWFSKVQGMLNEAFVANTEIVKSNDMRSYLSPLKTIGNEEIDVVLIDGIYRDFCTILAMRRLKRGGILILDNAERYLPIFSISPEVNSNDKQQQLWRRISKLLLKWKVYLFSNGVTDTMIVIKNL